MFKFKKNIRIVHIQQNSCKQQINSIHYKDEAFKLQCQK